MIYKYNIYVLPDSNEMIKKNKYLVNFILRISIYDLRYLSNDWFYTHTEKFNYYVL